MLYNYLSTSYFNLIEENNSVFHLRPNEPIFEWNERLYLGRLSLLTYTTTLWFILQWRAWILQSVIRIPPSQIESQQRMVQKILDPMPEMVAIIGQWRIPLWYSHLASGPGAWGFAGLGGMGVIRLDAINSGSRRDGRIGRGSNSLFFFTFLSIYFVLLDLREEFGGLYSPGGYHSCH